MKYFPFISFFFLFIPEIHFGQDASLRKQIEKIAKYELRAELKEVPGFIVGIIDEDNTYVEAFGNVPFSKSTLKSEDKFEIGNISKAITFEVVGLLKNQNKIQISKSINEFLPKEYQNPRLNTYTLSDLLSIQNILPGIVPGLGISDVEGINPYGHISKEILLSVYRDFVKTDDDLTNNYSNSDYGLLQICLERELKRDFQAILEETVNTYLDAGFFYTRFEQNENIVTPGIKRSGVTGKHWEVDDFAGALGLKADLKDLLQFARYKIEKHKDINAEGWEKLHENQPETWNPQVKAFEGLYLIKINNHQKLLASNGHSDIHSTFFAVSPITRTAVIVLSNSASGTQDLGMLVMRMINNNWKRKSVINVK